MWQAIGERGLESLHLLLPFHGLFLSANAGADANASGGRGECVWEQRRMRLGAEADADGAKFADKLGICIYEASGGDARCESGLRCIKPVGPVWQANPDCQAARKQVGAASPQMRRSGSYNISKSVGKISLY